MTAYKDRLDYIRSLFAPETPAQAAARARLTDPNDQIGIHAEEGKFLQFLVHLANVKTAVEIGTLGGYSALWIADALPADGRLYTIEKDSVRHALAQQTLDAHPRVTLLHGDALQRLADVPGPIDMIFIDADKLNYARYLDWAEQNVRKGGLIIGDNSLLFDAVWKNETTDRIRATALAAMQDFNRRLADPKKYCSILLPTPEGMTIAQKLF